MKPNNYAWLRDPGFWTDEFPERTTSRTTPYLFKDMIPDTSACPEDVLAGFAAIREAHAAGQEVRAKARVYVGEDRRDDLLPTALGAPGWGEGDFVPWMQDLAGAERFSLVINNLETASAKLAAGLGSFLRSLIDGWGLPLGGAEQVAFIGNYAGTAFGVHEGFEDAFLVHLGPNPKNFYTWPAEVYEKLTGSKDPLYGDYQWLLEHGEHFVLEPGDALFLPRRVFHVGTQDQFSISVAIPLYTFPYAAILGKHIIPGVLAGLLDDLGPDHALREPSPMAVPDGSDRVAKDLAILGSSVLRTAAEQVEQAAEQHTRRRFSSLLSNGGWEVSQHDLTRAQAAAAFDPGRVVGGASVALIAPYRLVVTGHAIFVRGVQIDADAVALPEDLVSTLNCGARATLPADDDVLAVIRALGAAGGLRVMTDPTKQEEIAS